MIVQNTLLKLLHKIYRKDKLTLELTKAISVQLYKVEQNIQEIAKQQYLDSASWGLDIFEKELKMKIIDASYTFDRDKLIFRFLADNRVDFRELAKDLAAKYKVRIELRQIGVRDKAKEISGIGPCGRELCCSCFLNNFIDTVSINMAKNQNIALNPNKINGQCGRLLCCLNYEDDVYTENRKDLPNVGDVVKTPNGEGKVVSIDILNKSYVVNVPDEGKIQILVKSE